MVSAPVQKIVMKRKKPKKGELHAPISVKILNVSGNNSPNGHSSKAHPIAEHIF